MGAFKRWLDDFKPADRGIGKEVNYIGEFSSEDHKHLDTKEALGKDEYTNTTVAVKTEDGGVARYLKKRDSSAILADVISNLLL